MEAVENLVISEAANAEVVVNKTCMQGALYGLEKHRSGVHLVEDALQTLCLFRTVGQDVRLVAIDFELA